VEVYDNESEIRKLRELNITKSNDLVLKTRYSLSVQEHRILLYLISKIRMNDNEFKEYDFQISEFSSICGYNISGGQGYKAIKDIIKGLRDKSFWMKVEDDDGSEIEVLMSWITSVTIKPKANIIQIKLNEKMMPYLLNLKSNFLDYKLYFVLGMKSQYGIRLYEILKSLFNNKFSFKKISNEEMNAKTLLIRYNIADIRKYMMIQAILRRKRQAILNLLTPINLTCGL